MEDKRVKTCLETAQLSICTMIFKIRPYYSKDDITKKFMMQHTRSHAWVTIVLKFGDNSKNRNECRQDVYEKIFTSSMSKKHSWIAV